jgi:hypothetical protein
VEGRGVWGVHAMEMVVWDNGSLEVGFRGGGEGCQGRVV